MLRNFFLETGESSVLFLYYTAFVEKPAETKTSIRLASHLVRAPNSRSGGLELGALTKSGETLGFRCFYTFDISEMSKPCEHYT